jgi:hypothetical protein
MLAYSIVGTLKVGVMFVVFASLDPLRLPLHIEKAGVQQMFIRCFNK